jgi:flagellar motor switch protein FliN/FliY
MADKSNVRLVGDESPAASRQIDEQLIAGVEVVLEARIGTAAMKVAELMALKAGDSVPLDSELNRDVELRLNGVTVARGELVAVGDRFGVRIIEIAQK